MVNPYYVNLKYEGEKQTKHKKMREKKEYSWHLTLASQYLFYCRNLNENSHFRVTVLCITPIIKTC